jgi:hypothetical protein
MPIRIVELPAVRTPTQIVPQKCISNTGGFENAL